MELKKPDYNDITILKQYLNTNSVRDCAFCLGNAILWADFYHVKYSIVDNMLIYLTEEEGIPSSFTFPIGEKYNFDADIENEFYLTEARKAFDKICAYFKEYKKPVTIHCATPKLFEVIDAWYPNDFQYIPDRDSFDYIYNVEKLTTLTGKKLHGKRNHINNFLKTYPDYVYEDITQENIPDCLTVATNWMKRHSEFFPELKTAYEYEYHIIEDSLSHMYELNMIGGLIKIKECPVAFTLGEPLSKDTFDVHFEKADETIQGAYPIINRDFVANSLQSYTYVNREEDLGLPGLRKAKLSYAPDILYEKGIITEKH